MTTFPTELGGPRVRWMHRQLINVKVPHDHDMTAKRSGPENKSQIMQAVVESLPVAPVKAYNEKIQS